MKVINKIHAGDELIINYDYRIIKGRAANGLDNIQHDDDVIKVILEGDNSYNPISIPIHRILEIIRKENKQ